MTQRDLNADHRAFRLHRLEVLEREIAYQSSLIPWPTKLARAYHRFTTWLWH